MLLRVKVEYSPDQDSLCSVLPGNSVKEEWKAELLARQSEFVQLWESEGPQLLATTRTICGKDFALQEVTARLSYATLLQSHSRKPIESQ